MLSRLFHKAHFLRLSLLISGGIVLTACSSLNQRPYDVDGIYNNSKIVVEPTHNNAKYYDDYFKEKSEDGQEYFTDVDNYSSGYNQAYGGWGDQTSETQIIYNYPHYADWGWGYPYGGWYGSNWGWSLGFGYGWGNYCGYPNYGWGWGYPYFGGYHGYYGWGYPYYLQRNVSRNNSYRALSARSMSRTGLSNTNSRNLRTNSLTTGRTTLNNNRTFSRVNSNVTRMNAANDAVQNRRSSRTETINRNDRIENNRIDNTRNNNINRNTNRNNTNRNNTNVRSQQRSTPTRSFTPSPSTRMNSGSMRSSGGTRSGGGGRR